MRYRDKYHFIVRIHNEHECQNDCLQSTFAHIFYDYPKLISATDAGVLFPGQNEHRHERACSLGDWGNQNTPIALLERQSPPPPPPSARRHNSGLHTGNDCHLRKDTGKNGLKKYSGQSKNTLKYFHLNCKMLKRSLTNLSNTWQNIESLFEISFWYITNSCEGVGWLEK